MKLLKTLTTAAAWIQKYRFILHRKKNCKTFLICDAFTHFVVPKPTPLNDAETAADVLLNQGIKFLGSPKTLFLNKGTEDFVALIANMGSFLARNIVQNTLTLLGRMF